MCFFFDSFNFYGMAFETKTCHIKEKGEKLAEILYFSKIQNLPSNFVKPEEYLEKCKLEKGIKWWIIFENIIGRKECNYEKCKRKDLKLKMCKGCKSVFYCGRKCQKKDWKIHKNDCFSFA